MRSGGRGLCQGGGERGGSGDGEAAPGEEGAEFFQAAGDAFARGFGGGVQAVGDSGEVAVLKVAEDEGGAVGFGKAVEGLVEERGDFAGQRLMGKRRAISRRGWVHVGISAGERGGGGSCRGFADAAAGFGAHGVNGAAHGLTVQPGGDDDAPRQSPRDPRQLREDRLRDIRRQMPVFPQPPPSRGLDHGQMLLHQSPERAGIAGAGVSQEIRISASTIGCGGGKVICGDWRKDDGHGGRHSPDYRRRGRRSGQKFFRQYPAPVGNRAQPGSRNPTTGRRIVLKFTYSGSGLRSGPFDVRICGLSFVMIGIDLGTTHSLVSMLGDSGPVILENEFGETLTPSVVAVAEDGTILTGRAARDRLVVSPESGRAFFKRDMGTEVQYSFGGRKWNPIECSAAILREMKRIAELRLGKAVESAVITVPAYFHDPQRQATVDAAKIAGLKVERLVNEPTAAALAWGFQRPGDDSTLMVFDLGGGTFDVTVLEVFDGVVEVKASSGESRLGGEDYTDLLADWLAKKTGLPAAKLKSGRLRAQVEQLKRGLSAGLPLEFVSEKGSLWVTPEDFRNATMELTARLWPVVRRCLRDGGITAQHLDAVLLVGGATRMPLVAEGIEEMLGKAARKDLDPDRVVAMGAAVQQALVAGDAAVSDLVLTDVCPHTLGVAVSKALMPGRHEPGFFEPLIDRNTTVPVSRSDTFSTLHPEQDELRIEVFQGESRMVKENRKVGELAVKGMKHLPDQRQPGVVEVRFTYDMSGLLEVEITVLATGKKTSKIFEERPGSMSPEQIEAAMRRLAPLKIRPRDLPPNRARLERANRLYAELTGGLRASLNGLIDQFEAALARNDEPAIKATAAELDSFLFPFFRSEEEEPRSGT